MNEQFRKRSTSFLVFSLILLIMPTVKMSKTTNFQAYSYVSSLFKRKTNQMRYKFTANEKFPMMKHSIVISISRVLFGLFEIDEIESEPFSFILTLFNCLLYDNYKKEGNTHCYFIDACRIVEFMD